MNTLKRLARVAAATILAAGIFAATSAPSDAAVDVKRPGGAISFDTGW